MIYSKFGEYRTTIKWITKSIHLSPTAIAYMIRAEAYASMDKNEANVQKRWEDIQTAHIMEPNDQKITKEFN